MDNNDTICLLKECDSGTKMAVLSIDEILEKDFDSNLRQLLIESRDHHQKLGDEIHGLLIQYNSEEKDPNIMAKGMSWIKTNIMTSMDGSGSTISDLMTDGCDMGIKTLYKYLHQYRNADDISKDICKRLISIEETLRKDLQVYL